MLLRTIVVIALFGTGVQSILAQSAPNPFDLQWRLGADRGDAVTPVDTAVASADVPEEIAEPEVVPPAEVTPEPVTVTTPPPTDPPVERSDNPFDIVRGSIDMPSEPPANAAGSLTPDGEEADHDDAGEEGAISDPPPAPPEMPSPEVDTERDAEVPVVSNLILFLLFGLVLLLITWAVNINRGFVRKVWRAALNDNLSSLLLREQKFASTQYLYYLVYVTFFINMGIYLYFVTRYTGLAGQFGRSPLMLFVAFAGGVYLVRHLTMAVLGATFPIGRELRHFSFNILLYNILLGLFLIPVNLFLAFGPASMRPWCLGIGLAGIVLIYLTRQFRGLVIGSGLIATNMFHFFVYLCTIEILPVLVLFKFLHN